MFGRTLILKTAALGPVERVVRRSKPFRALVKRFIAGDTLSEALVVAEELLSRGFMVSLDFLGENTHSEAEANQAKATYIAMLQAIAKSPAVKSWKPKSESLAVALESHEGVAPAYSVEPLNISIKLTQCGLDLGDEFAEKNYREVLAVAQQLGNFVRIDMEASEYTERTVQMMKRVLPDFPKTTGTVLQTYLYRTPDDVKLMIDMRARTRLVKGAYLEPASVAHPEKQKVDEAYVTLAKLLIKDGNYAAIATQDESIILLLKQFVQEHGINKTSFEFQMLFGIRRDLQESLLAEGYNVRVYVPFGDSWYPYFTRRLAERPANSLFILKSLFKG